MRPSFLETTELAEDIRWIGWSWDEMEEQDLGSNRLAYTVIGQGHMALVEARDRFSLVLKIVLYLFVAALIVAMYLPIFKIASVV